MAQFLPAVQYLLVNEGSSYTDNPADLGGPTKWGITLNTLSGWRKTTCTAQDVQNLTQQEAQQIYQTNYWDALGLDSVVDQNIATVLLDQAVNRGLHGTVVMLQQTLQSLGVKLKIDGVLGPSTRVALNLSNSRAFLATFIAVVQNSYVSRVLTLPSQIVFLSGWISRSQRMIQLLI